MNYTKTLAALIIAVSCLTANYAKADILYGTSSNAYDGPFGVYLMDKGTPKWIVAHDGISVGNKEDDTVFKVFCSDKSTFTSGDYSNSAVGQVYNPVSLSDSTFHSAEQKQQLQSLFDHVYWKAFDQNYSVIDPSYAAMFQLAVWEIMNDTSDVLSLRNGDLYIKSSGNFYNTNADRTSWGTQMSAAQGEQLLALTDSWFNAIINDSWDLIGYSEDKVNLTVWIAEGGSDVSQTFIGVSPTPEPATMLIFGLGAVGLAAGKLRKRIKK